MSPDEWEWTCACCGQVKRGIPDGAFDAPSICTAAEDDPEITIVGRNSDFCIVEVHGERTHHIRCLLPIPLIFAPGEVFGFGVWSAVSREDFRRYHDTFDDDDQSKLGELTGCLSNRLPVYPETEDLPLSIFPQDGGQRPIVRVREARDDHPLFADQRDGIGEARLQTILSEVVPCADRGRLDG